MSTIGDFLASRTHERFGLVGYHLGRLGAGVGRASPVDSIRFRSLGEISDFPEILGAGCSREARGCMSGISFS